MKKENVVRASIVFLFLFLMLLPYALKSYNVTNFSIVDISEETQQTETNFIIKSIDYSIEDTNLYISYILKDKSGSSRELKSNSVLRGLDGTKIAESQQTIVLEANQEANYKATLNSPYEIRGFMRLTLTVSDDSGSKWMVKNIDNSKSYITGFAISNTLGSGRLAIILIVVILILIYWIISHQKKHKSEKSEKHSIHAHRRKVLIPLHLKDKKKRGK